GVYQRRRTRQVPAALVDAVLKADPPAGGARTPHPQESAPMSLRSQHVALRATCVLSLMVALAGTPACAGGTAAKGDVLVLETKVGEIAIQLFPKDAPRTVENLRKLVSEGFYDGLTFHRIRPGFVIQGGD